jgi:acetyl-CoA synthetase
MDWPVIKKSPAGGKGNEVLADYDAARRSFTWDDARRALAGLPGAAGLNIAYEAVDRHVDGGRGDRIALRSIGKARAPRDCRYGDLADLSNRFANALKSLAVGPGDRVFTLLGRVPELYVAALGTWKCRAVLSPLFSAFGPAPIKARMAIAEPSVLVTTARLYGRKIAPIRAELPFLNHVILVGGGEGGHDFDGLLSAASGGPCYSPFHKRHDRASERRHARPCRRNRPPYDGALRP